MNKKYQQVYGELKNAELDEKELQERIIRYKKDKNQQDLDAIVKSHLKLIIYIAESYHVYGRIDTFSLVDAGVVGLLQALEVYDPSFNAKLASFANNYIKRAMLDEIQMGCTTISVSRHYHELRSKYKELIEKYSKEGKELKDEKAMELLSINLMTLNKVKNLVSISSLSIPLIVRDDDEDDKNYDYPSPERDFLENLIEKEEHEALYEALEEEGLLTEQERNVIYRHFGLKNYKAETLEHIAQDYKISKARICQIKNNALEKLEYKLRQNR